MSEHIHVTPAWEEHEDSPDCWCEPKVQEGGRLVIHYAKACPDGRGHSFFNGECVACGASDGSPCSKCNGTGWQRLNAGVTAYGACECGTEPRAGGPTDE